MYHKDDEILTDYPFYTQYKGILEHPDNCFNIFLILHKLDLISINDRHVYRRSSRRVYASKWMESGLTNWYRVPKTEKRVSYERREDKEVEESERILIRGVRGIS